MNQADAIKQEVDAALTKTFRAGALPHPGGENTPSFLIPIPGMRTTGMCDEQAQEMVGQAAKLWSGAITHIIDQIVRPVIERLEQAAADAPDGTRIVRGHRGTKHGPIVCELVIDKTDDVVLPEAILREAS